MVNLTRIYTRTGDAGSTRLSDMSETTKTDPRVEAYGTVDEANAVLGIVLAAADVPEPLRTMLLHIQNELFDVGADLSNPWQQDPAYPPLRIESASIDRLEAWCDELSSQLPDLASFILPGGSPAGAYLHLARTVVRRAERAAWATAATYGVVTETDPVEGGVNAHALTYLNRLSDLLFIASRAANGAEGDVLWVPGKDRQAPRGKASVMRQRISDSQRPEERPPAN